MLKEVRMCLTSQMDGKENVLREGHSFSLNESRVSVLKKVL
jgi:hypothetical protein